MKAISKTVPLLFGLLILLSLFVESYAAYYGYDEETDDIGQRFKVWVRVSTSADYVRVKWEGHMMAVKYGLPGGFTGVGVEVEDSKGFEAGYLSNKRYGVKYFNDYPNRYCRVYVKVTWMYTGAFWMFTITVRESVRVRS